MTKVSKFHFWSLIWARQFLQASLIWAGQFLQACGLKNQNRDLQKLPNMQINHNNPSLTSLQIEPSTQGPLVPSLSPLGFWTLWALALLLYLRARACAQKVGGGEVLAIPAAPVNPSLVWTWMSWMPEFGESSAKAMEVSFKIRPAQRPGWIWCWH